jgi:hypothetical protein
MISDFHEACSYIQGLVPKHLGQSIEWKNWDYEEFKEKGVRNGVIANFSQENFRFTIKLLDLAEDSAVDQALKELLKTAEAASKSFITLDKESIQENIHLVKSRLPIDPEKKSLILVINSLDSVSLEEKLIGWYSRSLSLSENPIQGEIGALLASLQQPYGAEFEDKVESIFSQLPAHVSQMKKTLSIQQTLSESLKQYEIPHLRVLAFDKLEETRAFDKETFKPRIVLTRIGFPELGLERNPALRFSEGWETIAVEPYLDGDRTLTPAQADGLIQSSVKTYAQSLPQPLSREDLFSKSIISKISFLGCATEEEAFAEIDRHENPHAQELKEKTSRSLSRLAEANETTNRPLMEQKRAL